MKRSGDLEGGELESGGRPGREDLMGQPGVRTWRVDSAGGLGGWTWREDQA